MRPSEALEIQARVLACARRKDAKNAYGKSRVYSPPRVMQEAEAVQVRASETFYIESDMYALALHAAKQMSPEPSLPSDLPCDAGFAVYDAHGKPEGFRWWRGAHPVDGRDGFYAMAYNLDPFRLDYADHCFWDGFVVFGTFPALAIGWEGDMDMDAARDLPVDDETMKVPLWKALFALMRQTLKRVQIERPDRPARRRLAKDGSPLTFNMIKVVTLRRLQDERGGNVDHGTVEWTHRWIVSGHPRNQWFPSLGAHRQIWISPYVKGDEDKPLVIKPTVNVLAR